MPILRGAVTFSRYRVESSGRGKRDPKKILAEALRTRAFVPLDREKPDDRVAGWVELEEHERADFSPGALFYGERALFTWRVDQLRIPAAQLKADLERWRKGFERENQRPPGKREKAEAKEGLRQTLRATAPIIAKTFDVSWNLTEDTLEIWAAARKMVDEVQQAVEMSLDLKLVPLVPVNVAAAMEIPDAALVPTPALSLPDAEVAHGKA